MYKRKHAAVEGIALVLCQPIEEVLNWPAAVVEHNAFELPCSRSQAQELNEWREGMCVQAGDPLVNLKVNSPLLGTQAGLLKVAIAWLVVLAANCLPLRAARCRPEGS